MRPTSTPPCGAGLNAIRASTSTSPRPPGSTWSSACSPISPVVVCVGDAFAVSPNSNQRSDATLTTATPLPNRSFGPKGPTPSFENTNGLNGTLFRGRDTSAGQSVRTWCLNWRKDWRRYGGILYPGDERNFHQPPGCGDARRAWRAFRRSVRHGTRRRVQCEIRQPTDAAARYPARGGAHHVRAGRHRIFGLGRKSAQDRRRQPMVQLTRIYTRGGDKGQTSLGDGKRVPKHDLRVAAYGTVDEVNSVIGLVRLSTAAAPEIDAMLSRIQNDLFDLGADLCTPERENPQYPPLRIVDAQVDRLESEIDAMNAELAPLKSFVLPGGTPAAAYLHLARTVSRRAERLMTDLAEHEPVGAPALKYINRLSDHLFVLSRHVNDKGALDVLWVPGANR